MSMNKTDALAAARIELARRRAAGEVETLDPLERAARNPNSLDLAIKAMCFECMGRGEAGGRTEIAGCDHYDCPLWQFRPYAPEPETAERLQHRAEWRARCSTDHPPMRAAAEDPASRRKAIKAKCYQCQEDDRPRVVYKGIADCAAVFPAPAQGLDNGAKVPGCPLWPHRPGHAAAALSAGQSSNCSKTMFRPRPAAAGIDGAPQCVAHDSGAHKAP